VNKAPRVATLAVGTEIVEGQISDRNSQWLSARAVELGYDVVEHRAVADDREKILTSLTELSLEADLLFVTGGLGPTSDDFTRECVARFLGEPLEWDEPSWQSILERLKARGATFTQNQKQQCYYPRSAQILKNVAGTANAFFARSAKGVRVVCLPGPPREIEAIWKDGLADLLKLPTSLRSRNLTLLRTMGLGEGALASRVEEIIDETLKGHLGVVRPAVGYRAHAPYVEIKLWADPSQGSVVSQIANSIRREFKQVLINEGTTDVVDATLSRISSEAQAGTKTVIFDAVTEGLLYARLLNRADERQDENLRRELIESCTCVTTSSFDLFAQMMKTESKVVYLTIKSGGSDLELVVGRGANETKIELPKLASSLRTDRGRKWATEIAFIEWSRTP
jgi:nicotinamide-nucleotide amidase